MFSTTTLQDAATANGNGTAVATAGIEYGLVEVVESAGGTCTLTFEGSFNGGTWYAVGYQQVDATATPARSVTAVSVTANLAAVFQILDFYPQLRARISSVAGGARVTARLFGVA